ncbi:hypothetical protein HY417_03980 [Candidatus Kaiserbacteria bacterium]|nr:hypothetical protein [Candidatus Kaiserbacteria bacterium]
MKTSAILGIGGAALIAILGYLLFANTQTSVTTENTEETTSGMRAEENAVVVMEQKPGSNITASSVFLASPGFLVIHEDVGGAPGAILGASALLQAGESTSVDVVLNRATRDHERLHAMLHSDVDGSGSFAASTDTPVQSSLGGPISGWFEVSLSASENPPAVSI